MPRFLVFGYDTYYPGGGLCDLEGGFDTEEEANEFIEGCGCEHHDILDIEQDAKEPTEGYRWNGEPLAL